MSEDTWDLGNDDALVITARAMRDRAYAPYSGFAVGAAIQDSEGRIHTGCNVENAAYPEGTCAEAGAISAMIAAGGRRIRAMAVAGPGPEPCMPCGGCRQRIREFAGPETPILACGSAGVPARFTLGDLLPESFGPAHLGRRES